MKKLLLLVGIIFVLFLVGCENQPAVEPVPEPTTTPVVEPNVETQEGYKVYEDKDLVFDTTYDAKFSTESYMSEWGDNYYAKDLKAPFINIDTDYAQKANDEIKAEFDKVVATYNLGASGELDYVDSCEYEVYESEDALSVKFVYGLGATSVVHPKYFTYNINMRELVPLLYEEACELCGISRDEINSKVEKAITDYMHEEFKVVEQEELEQYISLSIDSYHQSVQDYSLNYCISKEGKLEIVVNLKVPADSGEFDTLFTIE